MGKKSRRGCNLWVIAASAGAVYTYVNMLRPRMLRWGLEPGEEDRLYDGDEYVEKPMMTSTRAITIFAGPDAIWPWLVQIGYRRGGFYSYDWLENLIGLDIQSANEIRPEWQRLAVGDSVSLSEVTHLKVARLEPERALVFYSTMNPLTGETLNEAAPPDTPSMRWSWAFLLDPLSAGRTRLIIRVRADYQPTWLKPAVYAALDPVHFLMEQKMLRTIKERAEAYAAHG